MKHPLNRSNRAFSLVELLVTVAAVSVVCGIAVVAIFKSTETLDRSKLEQDVARLNSAVKIYLSSGGSLEGIDTAQAVVTELKKEANSSSKKTNVGLRGSMVDNRLEAVSDSGGEVRQRAVWNSAAKRFVLGVSDTGVSEFRMNEELGSVNYADVERQTRLLYNGEAGWVWATQDQDFSGSIGPSELPEINSPTLGARGGTGSANGSRLNPPTIAPGSGFHALATFPLTVTLTKYADDPDDVSIFYTTGSGNWIRYSGPFSVTPNTDVTAYSSSSDPAQQSSDYAYGSFLTNPEALEIDLYTPLNPVTYAEAGGELLPGDYPPAPPLEPIMVTLPNGWKIPDIYEDSEQFQFNWTLDGSDPLTSPTRIKGIKFTKGYRNNNGHGNNYSGIDTSNPNWREKAAKEGWTVEEMDALGDDEMKPFDRIVYTIDQWDGAPTLPVRVVARSKNPTFLTNSIVLSSNINIRRTNLRSPIIEMPSEPKAGDVVEISLEVDSGDMPVGTRIYYTTDGTDPGNDGTGNPVTGTLYTGPFDPLLNEDDSSGESMIIARAYPPTEYAAWFNLSHPSNSLFLAPLWEASGTASGWFSSSDGLSSDRWDTRTGSYFQWNDQSGSGVSIFDGVSNRERFQIGELSYFNGSGYSVGEIDPFNFFVDLNIFSTSQSFDYQFNQYVTYNNGTEWENADVISFASTTANQRIYHQGSEYLLNLEFGESTSNGAAISNEFQVQEGRLATAALYGTLIAVESWWFTD